MPCWEGQSGRSRGFKGGRNRCAEGGKRGLLFFCPLVSVSVNCIYELTYLLPQIMAKPGHFVASISGTIDARFVKSRIAHVMSDPRIGDPLGQQTGDSFWGQKVAPLRPRDGFHTPAVPAGILLPFQAMGTGRWSETPICSQGFILGVSGCC